MFSDSVQYPVASRLCAERQRAAEVSHLPAHEPRAWPRVPTSQSLTAAVLHAMYNHGMMPPTAHW